MSKKYYIPFRLSREFKIGSFSIRDFLILIALFAVFPFLFVEYPFYIIVPLTYMILAYRVETFSVGGRIKTMLLFIFKAKNYSIKDIFK